MIGAYIPVSAGDPALHTKFLKSMIIFINIFALLNSLTRFIFLNFVINKLQICQDNQKQILHQKGLRCALSKYKKIENCVIGVLIIKD